MPRRFETSLRIFEESRDSEASGKSEGARGGKRNAASHGHGHGHASAGDRERSAFALIRSFLQLLRPHRWKLAASLATATVATGLALVPQAATKFVVDFVLAEKPLPAKIGIHWHENSYVGLKKTLFHRIEIPLLPFDSAQKYVDQPETTAISIDWI